MRVQLAAVVALVLCAGCRNGGTVVDPPVLMLGVVYCSQGPDEITDWYDTGIRGLPILCAVWSDGLIVRNSWVPGSKTIPVQQENVAAWLPAEQYDDLIEQLARLRAEAGTYDGMLAMPTSTSWVTTVWREVPSGELKDASWWSRPDLAGVDPESLYPVQSNLMVHSHADFDVSRAALFGALDLTPEDDAMRAARDRVLAEEELRLSHRWMDWLLDTPGEQP